MALRERITKRLEEIKRSGEYKQESIRTSVKNLKGAVESENSENIAKYADELRVASEPGITGTFNYWTGRKETLSTEDFTTLNTEIGGLEAKIDAERTRIRKELEAEINTCRDPKELEPLLNKETAFNVEDADFGLLEIEDLDDLVKRAKEKQESLNEKTAQSMRNSLVAEVKGKNDDAQLLSLLKNEDCWISKDDLDIAYKSSEVKKKILATAAETYAELQIAKNITPPYSINSDVFLESLPEECRAHLSESDKEAIKSNYDTAKTAAIQSLNEAQEGIENKFSAALEDAIEGDLTAIANSANSAALKAGIQAVFTRKGSTENTDILSDDINHPINQRIKALAQLQKDVLTCQTHFDLALINQDRAPLTPNDEKSFVEKMLSSGVDHLDENQRIAIAKASDLNAFKDGVKRLLGVSDPKAAMLDAVSKDAIQRHICEKYFNEKYKANPALISLLTDLDLATQQQVIQDPEKIKTLQRATTPDQVAAVLGEGLKGKATHLLEENNTKKAISKIYNHEIVDKLTAIPGFILSAADIQRINTFIAITADSEDYFNDVPSYINLVRTISGDERVHEALGCGGTPLGVLPGKENIQREVSDQHLRNRSIIGQYDSALVKFLLPLKKRDKVIKNEFDSCYTKLATSVSKESFLNTLPFGDPILKDAIKDALDDETYTALKQEAKQDIYTRMDSTSDDFKTLINSEKAKLKQSQDKLDKLVNASYWAESTLQELGKIESAYWLDPSFKESSRGKARELEPLVKESAARYKELIVALEVQKKEIARVRSSLPTVPGDIAKTKILDTFKKELDEHEASINEQLAIYQPIDKKLNGDQSASSDMERKGYVGMIDSALTEDKDVQLAASNITYEDVDKELKNDYLSKTDYVPTSKRPTTLQVGGRLLPYKAANEKLTENKVRIAHISTKSEMGEDVVVNYAIEQTGNKITYTLGDVPKYPQKTAKNPDPKPKADVKVTAEAITNIVAEALMNLKEPPSKTNQFIISGNDPMELELYWTALMIAAEMHPTMKFNEEAIKVNGPFDPTSVMERNTFGKAIYKDNSWRKKYFDKSPDLKTVIRDSFQFGEDQKQGQHEYKKLFQNLKQVDGDAAKKAADEVIQQSKMTP